MARNIWVENPEMFENYVERSQNGTQVFVPEADAVPVIFVPDHQTGGFRAQAVTKPKRRLGF